MAELGSMKQSEWFQLGERLQRARNEAGLKQKQVADVLGVGRTTLVAIEKGERRVSQEELITMADLYGQELNALLRSRPSIPPLSVQFKAFFKSTLIKNEEEGELQKAASHLQDYCEKYLELEEITQIPLSKRYPLEYEFKGLPVDAAADQIASEERRRLDLGDAPIPDVRSVLETEVGLRIFYLELPSWMAGLFGYTEELGGCIGINIKHPPERRRISLAHEYCHFLTDRFRADVHFTRTYSRVPDSEKLAESFARRFNIPADGVRKFIRRHLQTTGKQNLVVADLVYLARYFNVSFQAFVWRLEELGIVGVGTHERLQNDSFQVRKAQTILEVNSPVEENGNKFPARYMLLAVTAFVSGSITEKQLADFLEVDRLDAREMVGQLSGQVVLDEEGQEGWMPWNIADEVPVRI